MVLLPYQEFSYGVTTSLPLASSALLTYILGKLYLTKGLFSQNRVSAQLELTA